MMSVEDLYGNTESVEWPPLSHSNSVPAHMQCSVASKCHCVNTLMQVVAWQPVCDQTSQTLSADFIMDEVPV